MVSNNLFPPQLFFLLKWGIIWEEGKDRVYFLCLFFKNDPPPTWKNLTPKNEIST